MSTKTNRPDQPKLRVVGTIAPAARARIDKLNTVIQILDERLVDSKLSPKHFYFLAISPTLNKMLAQHNTNITKLRKEIEDCRKRTVIHIEKQNP